MKPIRRTRPSLFSALLLAGIMGAATVAQAADNPGQNPSPPPDDPDALFELGRRLWEEFAPPEVKAHYDFPDRAQWDAFVARLQQALDAEDLAPLAEFAPDIRAALAAARTVPGLEEFTDWLAARLDYAEAAETILHPPGPPRSAPRIPAPKTTPAPSPRATASTVPHYELWRARLLTRPVPANAQTLLPVVRNAFAREGVPAELAWLAEVESTFNPAARSPAGAKGLYQLMPATARELGLRTALPDERVHAEKSARAAARYLRQLHARFGDWPLALAAYNAGPGRVSRILTARRATSFAEIAPVLPAETRMYVPKVLATLEVRAGIGPGALPPPR